MSLGKRLIKVGLPACLTDTTDIFGDSSGVALYSLDYDASDAGGNYDGTPTDVEFGVDGQINYGARFNGSSSVIQASGLNQFFNNWNDASWSAWINTTDTSAQYIVCESTDSQNYKLTAGISSNKLQLVVRKSGTVYSGASTTDINDGNWHHIAASYDNSTGTVKGYVDGSEEISFTTGGSSSGTFTVYDFCIGANKQGSTVYNPLDGKIDQVRIFSKALSSDEVSTLYAETACVYTCTTDTVNYPSGTTPVAYYKLDNSSEDFSTGGNDGTDTNIEYRFGRFGQAAVFNGSSSYIDTGIGSLTNNFTFSAWLNADDLTGSYRWVFGNWASSAQDIYLTILSDGTIEFNADGNNGTRFFGSAGDFTLNTWHHLVVSMDAGTYTVYLDNISLGSGATTNTTFNNGNNYQLGKVPNSSANEWSGKIDQVRIYSIALDSDQVSQLYNEKPCADTSNFKTVLYTGNGGTDHYISNVGMDLETNGGLVWIKNRDQTDSHQLFDSVRGAGFDLHSDSTAAQPSSADTTSLTSFDSNGFTVSTNVALNTNTEDYVAWVLKGGGEAVNIGVNSITASTPSIASDVSANQAAGFSIVKHTGNGVAATVGHGLSSAPELIIYKQTSSSSVGKNWVVYASPLGNTKGLILNLPNSAFTDADAWNNTTPTSTVFSVGAGYDAYGTQTNVSGSTNIAYCFHSVDGYQKIGSYTGATGGVTENIGFQPRWIMIKDTTDNVNNWVINDAARDTSNPRTAVLFPNLFNTEGDNIVFGVNFTLNGFEIPSTTTSTAYNKSGNTYIYLAIA